MEEETRNRIKFIKEKAEFFLENKIKAFIKDRYETYYFCKILNIDDLYLTIYDFRKQEEFKLVLIDVKDIKECREELK